MESYVQSHENNEVVEPRYITRGETPGQLGKIHGSAAQGSNPNKSNNIHTMIRGQSKKRKGESPTRLSPRNSIILQSRE